MTARLDVTLKTTKHNRIVSTGKSDEAEVTINKKNSAQDIILLKTVPVPQTTDRHADMAVGLFSVTQPNP